ncbi:RusA family crossover junction endodeoxyribonuclease [Paratractidigestivibacter faecalis]|uniref:RusA family crossover junction endodeoxyribonuclease n=1 Tax=Paratractidigestivibacter faecalis TaxID=2292441 RepID=UPI003A92AE93
MRACAVIEGRFPSLNDFISAERANRHVGAKMKRRETGRARDAAVAAGMPRFVGPVSVRFLWVERDRRRDLDNVAFAKKFVLDGLVEAGVLEDDGQRHVVALQDTFEVDPARPRVVVEVEDVDPLR